MEISRLAAIPLFAGLDERDLTAIAGAASEVEAAEGQTLATQGDVGDALYAIESGTADVSSNGRKLRAIGPGDVFGETAVMATGQRTATIVATSPMRLIALFQRDVWALERNAPEVLDRLLAQIVERQAAEQT